MVEQKVHDGMPRRYVRRYVTLSVSLFEKQIAVLDRVAAAYGTGRSHAARLVIDEWELMKQEREQN